MGSLSNVNKVILIGNIGANPELNKTNSGRSVTTLRLATNRSTKKEDGQFVENTEWHRAVVWGKRAETCAQYLKKGNRVYVEGLLQTRCWEDKDGINRYSTEILVDEIKFLSRLEKASGEN